MEFYDKAVASAIQRLRTKRKLSQEVLSGLSGMARPHLSMIERGERIPTLYTIWRLADALDMRPSDLVALIEEEMERLDEGDKQ